MEQKQFRIWVLGSSTPRNKTERIYDCFKKAVKTWNPQNCPCKLCKRYVASIVFTLSGKKGKEKLLIFKIGETTFG